MRHATDLDEGQALQWIETRQIWEAWMAARRRMNAYRHGMRWVRVRGRDYLVRVSSPSRNGKSLGPRSPETEAVYTQFKQSKIEADAAGHAVRERLERQARLNKAVRLARVPIAAARVLREIYAQAPGDFLVVGTHALFAYEAMAGIRFRQDIMASGDIDVLYDARRRIQVLSGKPPFQGVLAIPKKADPSFVGMAPGSCRALNKEGFMVGLLTQQRTLQDASPTALVPGDLVAAEVPGLSWLLQAPSVTTIAVGTDGHPVAMTVPDPCVFAAHKAWLSARSDREPVKRRRDAAQAHAITEAILERLSPDRDGATLSMGLPRPLRAAWQRLMAITESSRPTPRRHP